MLLAHADARTSRADPEVVSAQRISILGVDYLRLRFADTSELWLTPFGVRFREHLAPRNWYATEWFHAQRQRLKGTSAVYRVPSKPVGGMRLDLVVRFSRVGQEIPLDTADLAEYGHAEFNSPFEEFSLVMGIRRAHPALEPPRILTKRPLAVFSPGEQLRLWQTRRREHVFAQKRARHPEAEMDIYRKYIVVYGWIKGVNAVQACEAIGLAGEEQRAFLSHLTRRAAHDLELRGFRMLDMKPEHVIVRIRPDGSLLCERGGLPVYALVDYELIERFTR